VKDTPVMILAGGKGSRLGPLTTHRAKPSVPFGGRYRIIDFVLSNMLNSGYRRVFVLTQYMAHSLIRHITRNWSAASGMFLEVTPAQMRKGSFWYRGTADAVYQNLNLLAEGSATNVAVFGGDHIYKFDVSQMEAYHEERDADLTVAAFPVPRADASRFGVIQVDEHWRIVGFQEKPADPTPIPGQPEMCLVSMGNYIFKKTTLEDACNWVVDTTDTHFDFGKDIVPNLVATGARVFAYDFRQNKLEGEPENAVPYWIRAAARHYPPARFVHHGTSGAPAEVVDTLISEGSIVSSAELKRVVVGYDCFIHAESVTRDSILLSGCNIGSGARLTSVLCDKNCNIEQDVVIGEDLEADHERFPFITESGVIVLPKGSQVPAKGPIILTDDMAEILRNDPVTKQTMEDFEGRFEIAVRGRHSHMSSGPRYRAFGPGKVNE
jgi:glucose-1-phosphate adenylyltransferase